MNREFNNKEYINQSPPMVISGYKAPLCRAQFDEKNNAAPHACHLKIHNDNNHECNCGVRWSEKPKPPHKFKVVEKGGQNL